MENPQSSIPNPPLAAMTCSSLCNAITDALREMDKCPDDSVQDIWNEFLESWQTGLRMNHHYIIEANTGDVKQ